MKEHKHRFFAYSGCATRINMETSEIEDYCYDCKEYVGENNEKLKE